MNAGPVGRIDQRFSEPDASATSWQEVEQALAAAELYWLTTIRQDGRPHVTPLIGVFAGGAVHFCTGLAEQKARNLEHETRVALTTGSNSWAKGLDVVVEGVAERITDRDGLQQLADSYYAKYGEDWRFGVGDGVFEHGDGGTAAVFRVEAAKVLAFAKDPHAQTTFRLTVAG